MKNLLVVVVEHVDLVNLSVLVPFVADFVAEDRKEEAEYLRKDDYAVPVPVSEDEDECGNRHNQQGDEPPVLENR